MLRFPLDRLHVGVEPGRLTLVRVASRWRPTIISAEQFALPVGDPETLALPLLNRELQTKRWHNTRVHIVLSDSLVRYFVAPIPEGARNSRELREAAALRFQDIVGDEAEAWTVMVDLPPFSAHHLGCALRTRWLQSLQHCCRDAKMTLATLTPFGISEFNRNERSIGHRSGWFAALGSNTLWLGFKSGNGWRFAQTYGMKDSLTQLPQRLAQAQFRAGIEEDSCRPFWLAGQLADAAPLSEVAGTVLRRFGALTWPGQDASWSRTFRLALSPVWPSCA